mgnify:CR=1 FL=1
MPVKRVVVKVHLRVEREHAPAALSEAQLLTGYQRALAFGFKGVEAGPLVRSSYRAQEMWSALPKGTA